MLVWVGAGVGLAIMLGGRLHHGSSGAAGEIGYLPVPGAPIPRDVSRRGEAGASSSSSARTRSAAVAREHGYPGRHGADAVRAAVAAGTAGGPMLDEVARRLALGVASTCVVLDPPLVVLAGEVGQAGGTALAERVQHEVAAITLVRPRVVPTGLTEEPILQRCAAYRAGRRPRRGLRLHRRLTGCRPRRPSCEGIFHRRPDAARSCRIRAGRAGAGQIRSRRRNAAKAAAVSAPVSPSSTSSAGCQVDHVDAVAGAGDARSHSPVVPEPGPAVEPGRRRSWRA